MGYLGFETPWGQFSFGKQWSAYWPIAAFTDRFSFSGGLSNAIVNDGTFNVEATILSNGTPANCGGTAGFTDLGNNLGDDSSCVGFGGLTGLDFDLKDNGGPTMTHALFEGSSAINKAGQCGLPTDQRGSLRFDGMCDSGAYEFAVACRLLTIQDRMFSTGTTLDFQRPGSKSAPT